MIRVLIADDHPLVRRGLSYVLAEHADLSVVGDADSGDAVLDAVNTEKPDVLLLDVNMPGLGFLRVLELLRQHSPSVRTLVISGHAEVLYARRALRGGAAGYISKERAVNDLVAAIRVVASGGHYISSELAQDLAADLATGSRPPHELLSPREYEVMLLLSLGHTVTRISEQLHISVKTVSTHRTNLLEKMKLTTNAELARYAQAHGLAGP
ncbi:MAG: response regulator transcription factor [Gemmatimonadaceae bacterium]